MKRIVTAALLIFIVVLLIFRGQPWMMTLASALIAELAAYEYLRLANRNGARIPAWWMLCGTAVVFLFTLPNFWPCFCWPGPPSASRSTACCRTPREASSGWSTWPIR
jgi:CDP-diglyceride synthetase